MSCEGLDNQTAKALSQSEVSGKRPKTEGGILQFDLDSVKVFEGSGPFVIIITSKFEAGPGQWWYCSSRGSFGKGKSHSHFEHKLELQSSHHIYTFQDLCGLIA